MQDIAFESPPNQGGVPMQFGRQVRLRGTTLAVLLAAAYAIVWALGMASYHLAPPLDSAEQLVWSYATEAGYWKHPPLSTWLMHALVQVFGPSITLTLVAAQLCAAIALLLMWRLGREFMSARRSFAAAALTALIGYHGWGAETYNHNSALLPFQAAATLCFYLAVRRGRWYLWALTGLCAGLAMLVKYVALIPLGALLLYLALDRQTWTRRNLAGLFVAGVVAALVFAPHLMWLQAHDFSTLTYANAVAVRTPSYAAWAGNLVGFAAGQLQMLAPFLLVLAWMVCTRTRDLEPRQGAMPSGDRLFLWTVGLAPFFLVVLWGAATRCEVLPCWGYNVFLLAGWLALDALRWPETRLQDCLRVSLATHLALLAVILGVLPRVADWRHWQGRANFPAQELASDAEATWRAYTGQPLRLVVSDTWLGGAIVAFNGKPLAVVADGVLSHAPWVSAQDLQSCGALVVQGHADGEAPGVSQYMQQAAIRGEWSFAWAPWRGWIPPSNQVSRVSWGIIPPAPGGHCAK